MLIVHVLDAGPLRCNAIKRRLEGVTQKALTQALRRLERNGLVSRRVIPVSPVAVEYAITPLGRTLQAPFATLYAWTIDHMSDVAEAQREFDRRTGNPSSRKLWCCRGGLNSRPQPYQGCALPLSYGSMLLEEAWPWPSVRALVKARGLGQAGSMDAKTDRDKRLAAALRDNLKRRKAAGAASAQPAERDGDAEKDRDQG